jgi:hypothetical protein
MRKIKFDICIIGTGKAGIDFSAKLANLLSAYKPSVIYQAISLRKNPLKRVIPKVMENINNELKEIFVQMTAQQVYNKYIKPMSDSSEYTLPETGAMLFYAKKHPEGCNIDKITFTSLDEDYCVSLIESVMDSKDFAGWPFGDKAPNN